MAGEAERTGMPEGRPDTIAGLLRDTDRVAGVLLILATALALLFANTSLAAFYETLKDLEIAIDIGGASQSHSLREWVNDGLMAVFFILVGLEVRREFSEGALRDPRRSALAIAAAGGGVVTPALVYLGIALVAGGASLRGWAVPVATDIAFVVGLMGLLGGRVPNELKVFLTAMAVVDDLVAVLIIAVFFTSDLSVPALLAAASAFAVMALCSWLNLRLLSVYVGLGVVLWLLLMQSGVHPTIAGVLMALVVPRARGAKPEEFDRAERHPSPTETDHEVDEEAHRLLRLMRWARSPSHRMEEGVRKWVLLFVMPLFAFLNAGVEISFGGPSLLLAIAAGLVLGKPLGILAAIRLSHLVGLGALPSGVSWPQLVGAGLLAGVGFTMSLFIAGLAFEEADLGAAKMGVLLGSTLAAVAGLTMLAHAGREPDRA